MKNNEIKQANRRALPKFLLFAAACAVIGGMIGYYSGYGWSKGGMGRLVGALQEAGAFFGTHIAPWLLLAAAGIAPGRCAFKAYSATNAVCTGLSVVLAVCALVFDIGFLPSLAVCLVWIVNLSAYCKEAMRCSKAGNKI